MKILLPNVKLEGLNQNNSSIIHLPSSELSELISKVVCISSWGGLRVGDVTDVDSWSILVLGISFGDGGDGAGFFTWLIASLIRCSKSSPHMVSTVFSETFNDFPMPEMVEKNS